LVTVRKCLKTVTILILLAAVGAVELKSSGVGARLAAVVTVAYNFEHT